MKKTKQSKTDGDLIVNRDNIKKVLSDVKKKMKNADNQHRNSIKKQRSWLAPYCYKAGQSGNPNGRPKGKSLKEYTRDMLAAMTDEEREEFMEGLPKETIWKMAEGNPDQNNKLSGPNGEPLFNDEHKTKARGAIKKYLDRANTRKGR